MAHKPQKLVVYTVLVGDKEELNNPLHYLPAESSSDLEIEYLCFTDSPQASPTWSMREFGHPLLPPEKLSRRPKALPHEYLPNHDHSLYIDNTVVFKRLPCAADLSGGPLRGFRHPWRSNPLDEADIIAKAGLDLPDTVAAQIAHYDRVAPLADIDRLTAGTVLLRRHHEETVRRFGELWWEQVLLFSKRDQISLDLCARIAGCPVDYFAGDQRDNDLFIWPALPSGRRVLGSFDADRYAWDHRGDPVAAAQPRLHFLASGAVAADYDRRVSTFAYACRRVGSSLGDLVPPRRGIAEIVGDQLAALGEVPGRVLVVGVRSAADGAAEPAELAAAEAAIEQYYRFATRPETTLTLVTDDDVLDPPPFRAADGKAGFRLVLVLGMPQPAHRNALAKFAPLLADDGRLLVEFTAPLALRELDAMHAELAEGGELSVYHGRHIDSTTLLASSVVVLVPDRA